MSGAIGPGSLLLCVDAQKTPTARAETGLVVGRIYECVGLGAFVGRDWTVGVPCYRDDCGAPHGLFLRGIDHTICNRPDYVQPLCPNRFIPAGKRGDFESLLVSTPIDSERPLVGV